MHCNSNSICGHLLPHTALFFVLLPSHLPTPLHVHQSHSQYTTSQSQLFHPIHPFSLRLLYCLTRTSYNPYVAHNPQQSKEPGIISLSEIWCVRPNSPLAFHRVLTQLVRLFLSSNQSRMDSSMAPFTCWSYAGDKNCCIVAHGWTGHDGWFCRFACVRDDEIALFS